MAPAISPACSQLPLSFLGNVLKKKHFNLFILLITAYRFTTSLLFPKHLRNLVFRQSLLAQLLSYSIQLLTLLR